eukprot:scaffold101082_cov49-Phaeocystis_antarctica.AAC.3
MTARGDECIGRAFLCLSSLSFSVCHRYVRPTGGGRRGAQRPRRPEASAQGARGASAAYPPSAAVMRSGAAGRCRGEVRRGGAEGT